MSCGRLVFDTGPLSSFAVVGRLGLLEGVCAGHGAWPLSVQRELRAGARAQPALAGVLAATFLGVPEVLEHPAELLEAELLRVRLAGSSLSQRHNRGEAERMRRPCRPELRFGGHADGASVGGAVWTSGPPLGGGRSRGSKG